MTIRELVFATGNQNKMREIREILKDLGIPVHSQGELGIDIDVEENGTTFAENALIKAKAIAAVCGKPTLADDSGLVVDYLDGAPGVYSARYLGRDTSYDIKNQYIIDQLADAKGEERSARFVCAIALAIPMEDGTIRTWTTEGVMEGQIGYKIAGANGFGYDPIFYLPQYGMTSAEISPEQKNSISHRGQALVKIEQVIRELVAETAESAADTEEQQADEDGSQNHRTYRILVVSDTHGKTANLTNVVAKIGEIDMLLHLGDVEGDEDYIRSLVSCPVHMVKGNCDTFTKLPATEVVDLGEHRIFMAHGHRHGVQYGPEEIAEAARDNYCDVAFYGHTHEPKMDRLSDVIIANPGSLSLPRQDSHRPTFLIFEIDRKGEMHFVWNSISPDGEKIMQEPV